MKTTRLPWFRLVLVLGVAAVSLNFAVSWGQSAAKVDEATQHRAPAARQLNVRSAESAAPTGSLSSPPSAGARCRRG